MQKVRNFVLNRLWWLVLFTALVLLIVHSFGLAKVVVDNTSLILLVLILLSPFVAAIKKIKIGEFEAEIAPEEVRRVAESAEKSISETADEGSAVSPAAEEAIAAINALAETDPVVALAKLRIEIESRLRRLHRKIESPSNRPVATAPAPPPLARLIRDLAAAEAMPQELASAIRDVVAICNRAVHGEDIRDVDAKSIVRIGASLIEELERTLHEYGATHPIETTPISHAELDQSLHGTIQAHHSHPLCGTAGKRVYVVDQEELESFFEGYSEFAEFVVALEKLE
jgi:hypothetical protein